MAQKFALSEERKSLFWGRLLQKKKCLERTDEGIHGVHTETEEMLTSGSELQVLTG